jgi:hypothetical protein
VAGTEVTPSEERARVPGTGAGTVKWTATLAILLLAAALRFTGLGWGLRHPPHMDERVFVENVFAMIEAGDLDHRYYEYPGLVFYLLWPLLRPLADEGPSAQAYLLARALVAAAGVAGCALLVPLGRRLHSVGVGLFAALLMAVSLVAVETAHMFRPDVVLQALSAAALLAFARLDGRRRAEAAAGLVLGLALATKFTGVLLVPSYVCARLLAPGPRLRRLVLGAAVAGLAFALTSPYAVLHAREFVAGVAVQLRYHYQEDVRATTSYLGMLGQYARVWGEGLGWAGTVLSLVGLETAARAWRRWLPSLLLVVSSLLVLATSDVRQDRFLLPALSVGCLLAGAGAARVAGALAHALAARVPWPTDRTRLAVLLAVAAAAAAMPLRASFWFAHDMTRPQTRDLVLDWVSSNVPSRSRVLSTVPLLGLDTDRLEVLAAPPLSPGDRPQVLEADVVLTTGADDAQAVAGLHAVYAVAPETKYQGRTTITAWTVPAALRPAYRRLDLASARLATSDAPQDLAALTDGRDDTWWRTRGPQQRGDFIEVHLPAEALLARVELALGQETRFAARQLRLEVAEDGLTWGPADTVAGRPPVELQVSAPPAQVLLLSPPRRARALRLVQTGLGWRRRWGVAELRVWELEAR